MFAHRVSPPALALKVIPVALQGTALHSSTRCARYSRQTCSRSSPLCKRCCYFFMKRTRHAEEDIFCDTLSEITGVCQCVNKTVSLRGSPLGFVNSLRGTITCVGYTRRWTIVRQ